MSIKSSCKTYGTEYDIIGGSSSYTPLHIYSIIKASTPQYQRTTKPLSPSMPQIPRIPLAAAPCHTNLPPDRSSSRFSARQKLVELEISMNHDCMAHKHSQ
ncbi:hypothetical protein TgHK011_002538 [Trichoderma gracile]|nr:hypothetical protein TgHK011_002538 [Trichoderma gracile]